MTSAAFSAAYSDFKLIKTRGVVSISFEIPLQNVDLALQALGGMPDASKERWFGIAALQLNEGVTVAPDLPVEAAGPCGESLDRPRIHRKPIDPSKKLAQQAGILCADPVFWRFLREQGYQNAIDEANATEVVRHRCVVKSRAEIIPGTVAADNWDRLYSKFVTWKLVPA